MNFKVFALRDIKANTYLTPMFLPTLGLALRTLGDEVNKTDPADNNMLARHPEDFELFELGEFDANAGRFTSKADPVSVMLCINLKVTSNGTR